MQVCALAYRMELEVTVEINGIPQSYLTCCRSGIVLIFASRQNNGYALRSLNHLEHGCVIAVHIIGNECSCSPYVLKNWMPTGFDGKLQLSEETVQLWD